MSTIRDLLLKYRVDGDFHKEIRKEYRNDLQSVLSKAFDQGTKVNFRYGGSLAKGTANKNSCDIDLLCYLDSNSILSIEDIFKATEKALRDNGYHFEPKNSAIKVLGKLGESIWDISVDVVPGKYSSNVESGDVYLWCKRTKSRLKTNPETHINKVKESDSKDVIRTIKLFRDHNNFKFKSFFLEIFAIDVVEPDYEEGDSLVDKLIRFCDRCGDIGRKNITDPANLNNDIMTIHNEWEFERIRDQIKKLRNALLTDDEVVIENCILNKPYDENQSYVQNAGNHSSLIKFNQNRLVPFFNFTIQGYYSTDYSYRNSTLEYTDLSKDLNLKFVSFVPGSIAIKNLSWIICNAGYEAKKAAQLRGDRLEQSDERPPEPSGRKFIKYERAAYHGNHFVQAILETTSGRVFYSNIITVKIRK